MPITDDEAIEILEVLRHGTVEDRVSMLQILTGDPTGSPQVLEAVEQLLEDRTVALTSIPYRVGEVRWVAAFALCAERRAAGITDPVVLTDVPDPVSGSTMDLLARPARLPLIPGITGLLETFDALRKRGLLPTPTLRLRP